MKPFLFSALIGLGALQVHAQTSTTSTTSTTTATTAAPVTTPPAPNPMMQRMLSSLTPEEQNRVMAARTKALADNPGLMTDQTGLMEKGMMLQSGSASPEDKQAFHAEMKDFVEKMRAAMLKADPTIKPILDKLEAEGMKMRSENTAPPQ